ncbi:MULTISPECIES: hypothetical protein [unclassified Microbacterium]|uniref:hypothetical protein n=1 Tax=unclassified Microbacterium TaxID=2609290 RepID=UPI000EAA44E6|nr:MULTISPECIES: hypothetical protein [unclassified Microbacterium]MBT2484805.1 hypothetical protein [Microbacterium sp. ISL-108]RKN67678.1 hypothetical protein D7252_08825 [Microbacterium sp. CGR2]
MSTPAAPVARVHVDDYDPEVYRGEDALLVAEKMANVFRGDFPGAIVGVSYNPEAAESKRRLVLESFGFNADQGENA